MKYQPPVNSAPTELVPEPPYFDGNPAAGQKGAIPPAKAIEHPQREILAVIQAAGLTPDSADLTQLLQAIQVLAAGAGGTPVSFAYNAVYPEIISNGGVASIASSAGQVVLAAGQQWIWRGGLLFNSSTLTAPQRTLPTVASKTYHMRWRYNAGAPTLALYDLADVAYNPGAVADTDPQFDTSYDDMLFARVATSASNVPTVTALFNRNRLAQEIFNTGPTTSAGIDPVGVPSRVASLTWNWARRPLLSVYPTSIQTQGATAPGGFSGTEGHDHDFSINPVSVSRYGATINLMRDYCALFDIRAQISA